MDDRNGTLYPSREAAQQAGVPDEHIVTVEPEVVLVTSGPFKGRRYRRTSKGLVRLRALPNAHPALTKEA